MPLQRATYTGKSDILDGYDAVIDSIDDGCMYSVWVSKNDISFQCVNRDQAKARQMLEAWIDSIESAENDDIFLLKFHPLVKGFIDRKTTVICMFPIRVMEVGEGRIITGVEAGRPDYRMYKLQDTLENLPAMIDTRINAAIEARLKDIDQPETDQVDRIMGVIGSVANNPAIMSAVGQILNFLKPPQMIAGPRINGVQPEINQNADNQQVEQKELSSEQIPQPAEPIDENLLNNALDILEKHCRIDTDLMLLANLAESNPTMFGMFLMQLRTNQ